MILKWNYFLYQYSVSPWWYIDYPLWHLITGCHLRAGLTLTSGIAEGLSQYDPGF